MTRYTTIVCDVCEADALGDDWVPASCELGDPGPWHRGEVHICSSCAPSLRVVLRFFADEEDRPEAPLARAVRDMLDDLIAIDDHNNKQRETLDHDEHLAYEIDKGLK